ncbi:PIN domain-containing protein [Chitinophaga sancti]|uniref:PIN domain-containing protein n=1 Tax=Chitinophaga sancti TaxID=1004 RepID=A0A1K1MWF6_9BACT|nr:hypothetical protein [Chitinophaga sancti]WQD63039.1 hypothetical protein U0033_01435 [Chitinophaga sancti]WQG91336.1 hypothetical protein SR876_07480 [Chitinophaga sancti]SFW27333.1 hypothetical protein SAMN05661012_00942 [Chitinophaga sancti]
MKEIIYVDTSVFGGCFDKEFMEDSLKLMEEFKRGSKKMMYSNLVSEELKAARNEVRNQPLQVPLMHCVWTKAPFKARLLANRYIAEGILGYDSEVDAMHIATATLQNADVVASWNFKHMANESRIQRFNKINTNMGLRTIKIKTPHAILNP